MDYEIGDRVNFRLDGDKSNVRIGSVITEETDDGDFNVEYTDDFGEKKIVAFNRSYMPSGFKNIDARERKAKLPTRPPGPETEFQRIGRMIEDPEAYYQEMLMPYIMGGSVAFLIWWNY
jgi:hypothetical protein